MRKVAFYGNWDGRVDRSAAAERAQRAFRPEDAEEAWVDDDDEPSEPVRRSSRDLDPRKVKIGLLRALACLLETGEYTTEELSKIFGMSRATVYRHIDELRNLAEYRAVIRKLDAEELEAYLYDDKYDEYDEDDE